MTRRRTSGSSENGKSIKKVIKDLQKRSEKPLKIAKETLLDIRVDCSEINEALEHYAKNWNDFVHPGLMSMACEAVGGNPEKTVPMQVVLLLLTAGADIHDDIIDKSNTKYGKPTVFGKFGEDIALLVGDALLIKALTFLYKINDQFSKEKVSQIWDIIVSRFFKLGEAEALETSVKGNMNLSPEECLKILEKKASTFEAHTRIGALVGGENSADVDLLGDYGKIMGILLSVREDFIDIFEPDELKNRVKNECLPLPILYTFKSPNAKKIILEHLSKQRISDKNAEAIVDIVLKDKNVEKFRNQIKRLAEDSCSKIDRLKNEKLKLQLATLTRSIIEDL